MILQLNPPIPLQSPKGSGMAHFLVDRGIEHDNEWIVFQDSGEIWSWRNRDIRLQSNLTFGRTNEKLKNCEVAEVIGNQKFIEEIDMKPWAL